MFVTALLFAASYTTAVAQQIIMESISDVMSINTTVILMLNPVVLVIVLLVIDNGEP